MQRFMKMLNNISRSQALYRQEKISEKELQPCHYAFVMAICKSPGCSQEELARELCINKSTVARNLSILEEKGFVTRVALENDKRQLSVRPTERMLSVLPEIKRVSLEWMTLLAEGIPDGELEVFTSVLQRMEQKARRISEGGEEKR